MIKCKKCGRENDDSFFYCIDCGNELLKENKPIKKPPPSESKTNKKPSSTITRAAVSKTPEKTQSCPHCRAVVSTDSIFCTECGLRLDQPISKGRTVFMHQATQAEERELKVRLVLIKPDGTEAESYTMRGGKMTIGQTGQTISFPNDPYVSTAHAEISFQSNKLTIKDLDSTNGVYWKITDQTQIYPGAYFRIGRQLLRLELPGECRTHRTKSDLNDDSRYWAGPPSQPWARLVQVLDEGKIGEIHLLMEPEILIGREEGEVRFALDPFISSRHTTLKNDQGNCYLYDLDSSNGTYLRIQEPKMLVHQDRIQVGNQVLKIDIE